MKILLTSINCLKLVMPPMPLGLASIAAQIDKSRHEIRVLDLMFSDNPEDELKKALSDLGPDVIAISIRNLDNQSYIRLEYLVPESKAFVDLCRDNSGATIVVGGPAFSVSPTAMFEYLGADFGVVGEGEVVFPQLADRIADSKDTSDLPGLVWRDNGVVHTNPPKYLEDLDSLKPPRRDLFDNQRYIEAGGFGNIVIKQGCSFRCLYCDAPNLMGRQWRKKSPTKVVDELESMRDMGINVSFLTDTIFNFPPEYAKQVCHEIINRGVGMFWITPVHPKYLNRELVELMKAASCNAVSLGCDTCSEKMLKALQKDFTKAELLSAAELLEEFQLNYVLSVLFGGPGENRETVEETVEFLEKRSPFMLSFNVGMRLVPGTALREIAIEEGIISAEDPLMEPKFYVSADVKDWIEEYLSEVCSQRPNWTLAYQD